MTFSFAPNPWATSKAQDVNEKNEELTEALKGDQHKLDHDGDGDIDGDDFKKLRGKKKKKKNEDEPEGENGETANMNPKMGASTAKEERDHCHSKDHDCATVVEHPEWGIGKPVYESHAVPTDDGYVAWYDVEFAHGIEKEVPAEDMTIYTTEKHSMTAGKYKHKGKKVNAMYGSKHEDEVSENNPAHFAAIAKANAKRNKERGVPDMPNMNDPKFKMTKKDKMTKDPMNPTGAMTGYRSKMDHVEKDGNMSIREKLLSVVERANHGNTEQETYDDMYKGAGAKKMRKDHQNMKVDTTRALGVDDASKAGKASKQSPARNSGDKTASGEKNIKPSATPIKDPAASKNTALESVMAAYESMYDEDVLSENILSKLPGAHGRYMKKLKVAHDHHKDMQARHTAMAKQTRSDDDKHDPDQERKHIAALDSHYDAADAVKKLAVHTKKNKLGGHPTDDAGKKLHNKAKSDSADAHKLSHMAIKYDRAEGDFHKDHTEKLAKHVDKHGPSDSHKHL